MSRRIRSSLILSSRTTVVSVEPALSWSPFKNSTSARRRFHKVKGELWPVSENNCFCACFGRGQAKSRLDNLISRAEKAQDPWAVNFVTSIKGQLLMGKELSPVKRRFW